MDYKTACVILNYNDYNNTLELVRQIKEYATIDQIIVVDNASTDGSMEKLSRLSSDKVSVYRTPKNGGYGYGNNFGIKIAKEKFGCQYAVISNPDVRFEEDVILKTVSFLENNANCAIVSPLQLDSNEEILTNTAWPIPAPMQCFLSSLFLGRRLFPEHCYDIQNCKVKKLRVDCVAGSFLCLNIDLFLSVGGYDEKVFLYYEETMLGLKLKERDLESFVLTDCVYRHFHSTGSISKNIPSKLKLRKMLEKSRYYMVKNYMTSSKFVLLAGKVCYIVAIAEAYTKAIIQMFMNRKCAK